MKQQFDIIIRATGEGIKNTVQGISDGFNRGQKAVTAFQAALKKGDRVVSSATAGVKNLIGAYLGWQGASRALDVIRRADEAMFSMQSSIKAASREFENTGSIDEWEGAVGRLSDELKIYSESALRGAISRTVDMTKRLGLSSDQMEEVIRRSADLGAGKTDLSGAIERVTAALRGEAEASEYLGLTLNENYVKAWYEAHKQTEQAWKDLDDLQKAQVRYQILLEQSAGFQGRAAESVKTFGGALALVKKEIEDAIVNNKSLTDTMGDLADTLRENSGEIGEIVSALVSLAARAVELAVKWKGVILALAGTSVAISVLSKIVLAVKAINIGFAALTGSGIIAWMGQFRGAMAAAVAQSSALALAFKGFVALAAAQGVVNIGRATKAFFEMRDAQKAAADAQQRLMDTTGRVITRFEEFKDIRLPEDFAALPAGELEEFSRGLRAARAYWTALKTQLETKAEETTMLGTSTEQAREARAELAQVNARLVQVNEDLKTVGAASAETGQKLKEAATVGKDALEEYEAAARKAYEEAANKANEYADKVIALEEKIRQARLSTEDKIRALRQRGMTDEQAYADRQRQIQEKLSAARAAAAAKDYDAAEDYYKDVVSLAERSVGEIKSEGENQEVVIPMDVTLDQAIATIETAGKEMARLVLEPQRNAAEESYKSWRAAAEKIKADLDAVVQPRQADINVELQRFNEAKARLADLTKTETKTIIIRTIRQEAKAAGGMVGMATGGRLPGYGGGDRVRALLEAGEFVMRKEAVRRYGAGLFEALNSMRLQLPGIVKARIGGLVPQIRVPVQRFAAGGPVSAAEAEAIVLELRAGNTSLTTRAAGGRAAVKALEKELVRMGLAYAG